MKKPNIIRELRKNVLRQTQEEFAERFGLSRRTVQEIEAGNQDPPDEFIKELEALCFHIIPKDEAEDGSLEYLLEYTEFSSPDDEDDAADVGPTPNDLPHQLAEATREIIRLVGLASAEKLSLKRFYAALETFLSDFIERERLRIHMNPNNLKKWYRLRPESSLDEYPDFTEMDPGALFHVGVILSSHLEPRVSPRVSETPNGPGLQEVVKILTGCLEQGGLDTWEESAFRQAISACKNLDSPSVADASNKGAKIQKKISGSKTGPK